MDPSHRRRADRLPDPGHGGRCVPRPSSQRAILLPSIAAVLLVGFQAYLGRETVQLGNTGESVTAHLAAAMALVGLLVYLLVSSSYPARLGGGGSQRFTLLAAFAAAATFGVLLFGANVTARDAGLVFPDWPLMNGSLVPAAPDGRDDLAALYGAHALHRYAAAVVLPSSPRWHGWPGDVDRPSRGSRDSRSALLAAVRRSRWSSGRSRSRPSSRRGRQTLHVALGALPGAARWRSPWRRTTRRESPLPSRRRAERRPGNRGEGRRNPARRSAIPCAPTSH